MLQDLLIPGYRVNPLTGGWETLPWPGDPALPPSDPSRIALLPPSLGPLVISWAETYLIDPKTGKPWRFTAGQKRFLHMWYAVDPLTGEWVYRSGVKRGAKGTGKDPLGAAIVIIEMCGPVKFICMEQGVAVGRPHRMSLVQIGANSRDQAKDLLRMARHMISQRLKDAAGLEPGETQITSPTGSRVELLTTAEGSNEGDPVTAILLNETHHMTHSSGGENLANVARRNVGKSERGIFARVLELTNAHAPGNESVAEKSFNAWAEQQALPETFRDILYDSVEAEPGLKLDDPDDLMRGLRQAYADAPWAHLERLAREALDTRTTNADTIRFYFNGLAAAEDMWVEPRDFDDRARPDITVDAGEKIAMFLDCSKSGDATTLCGCRLSDGHVMALGGWRKPHGHRGKGWLAPREEVDATVRAAMAFYDVVWFGVDPSPAKDEETEHLYWMPLIDQWHRDFQKKLKVWASPGAGGHSVLFDMRMSLSGGKKRNQLFTEAAMQTVQDISEDKTLTHDGDPMLRQHVHNARRRTNQWGISLGKINRSSDKLVDYAVTMVGARMGRQLALRSTKVKTTSRRRGARRIT